MQKDLYDTLLNASFRFVSYRPRSAKEIRDFLKKKLKSWNTVGQSTVDRVLTRLGEYGYINDEKFARWWIEQRTQFRAKGMRFLVKELAEHGVGKETVAAVLGGKIGSVEPYNELEAARQAIKHKLALWKSIPSRERHRKVYGFLGRRGFSADAIRRVIDEDKGNRYNGGEEKNVFGD